MTEYNIMRKHNDEEAEVYFTCGTESECKQELKNLREYLESCNDETVTVGGLENWGRRFKITEKGTDNVVKYAITMTEVEELSDSLIV